MGYTGEQKRKYQREWIAARRSEFLSGKSCVICGSTDRLEVDHINPDEKISHNVWSWKQERRDEELNKCQILCHEHHLKKTATQRREKISHGLSAYRRVGCRCEVCKEAVRAMNAKRYL